MGTDAVSYDLSPMIRATSLLLLMAAAVSDVVRRIIPDRICIALAALGMLTAALRGPRAMLASIAASAVLFAALALLHRRGMLGGGDVKLASAFALGLPLSAVAGFLEMTAFAGGVLALLHLGLRPFAPRLAPVRDGPLIRRVLAAECWRLRRHGSLPYGVAIACGGAIMLLHGS